MSLVIDTGAVPEAERFDLWADATPRVFEPLSVSRDGAGAPFAGRVLRWELGPLAVYRLSADASVVRRTPSMIAASDPEWVQVGLLLGGRCAVEQDGRRTVLRAGDLASWASSRPYAIHADTHHDLLVTYCPEELLRPAPGSTAVTVGGTAGTGLLARQVLTALLSELEAGRRPDGEHDVAQALLDLFRGLHGARAPQGPADVLRAQVRAYVDAHLGDPALGPQAIARAHHVSRRTLDRLFAGDGETVAELVRRRRLERCRADLADPRHAHEPVLEIAMRWGFVSAAHFSRSFRAAYGMAPRDAR
jgi:AraC-like DNA-binding protein